MPERSDGDAEKRPHGYSGDAAKLNARKQTFGESDAVC